MNDSSNSLRRSSISPHLIARFFAIIGFADAVFLTAQHYLGKIPPCSVVSGCESVLTSQYATILGVPIALLGAFFYLAILIRPMRWLAVLGFLASLILLYIQIFTIGALCVYCMVSLVTSTGIFVSVMYAHYTRDGDESGRENNQGTV